MAARIRRLARLTAARAPALAALLLALLAPAAAAGAPRWLAPQPLTPPGMVWWPRVVVDAQGNALAAWVRSGSGVVVSTRPAGGVAWDPPAPVPTPAFIQAAQIAVDGVGGAAVLWTAPGGGEAALAQAAIRPAGSAQFGPAQTLSSPSAFAIAPRLAADGRGGMVAVWEERAAGRQGLGVVMAAARAPGDDAFGAAEALSDPAEEATQPDVALDAAGDAVAVWVGGPLGGARSVRARARPAAGGAWSPAATISAANVGGLAARVALDPTGTAVAAWTTNVDGVPGLQSATRTPAGAWSAPEELGPAASTSFVDPPAVLAEPDGTHTIVFARPDGLRQRLSARVRPPGGAWLPTQDLSPSPLVLSPSLPFSSGDRASVGARGGVAAVWTRSSGVVQAAVKPAGATAFEPAADISAVGRYTESPTVAAAPDGEAVAAWASRPSIIPFDQTVIESADFTSRPGPALEPPPVQVTAVDAPASAAAGTVVRLAATLAAYVDPALLTPQRLVDGAFVDAGAPVTVRGTTASVPVRLLPGANVLRLAYVDRGTPGASQPVTVTGTRPGRALIPAGTHPIAIEVGLGAVWALSVDADGQGSVIRIDPRARRAVGDPIPVGPAAGLAIGADAVWVAAARGESPGLRRIDPAAMRVTAEFPLQTTGSVAVGAGGVWTIECGRRGAIAAGLCGDQRLVLIDPRTNLVTRSVQVLSGSAGNSPLASGLTIGSNQVWFRVSTDDGVSVMRYDPAGGGTAYVQGSGGYGALDASGSTLWTVSDKCALSRATGSGALAQVLRRLPGTQRFSCGTRIVAGPRDLWVGEGMRAEPGSTATSSLPAQIARIDARTGHPVGVPITLGRGPTAFAVGEGVVWVAYTDAGVVARIDPRPAARARVRAPRPRAVALAGGLWSGARTLSTPGRNATAPDVAAGGRGRAAAIWLSAADRAHSAIESAIRPAAGVPWAPARTLDRTALFTYGEQPRVAASATGEAAAIWSSRSGSAATIRVRTSLLGPRASAWRAAEDRSAADRDAIGPTVAMGADGGAAALWSCRCAPPPPGSLATPVMAATRPAGGVFGAPTPLMGPGPVSLPAPDIELALGGSGAALAAWAAGPPGPGLIVTERRPDGTWSQPVSISRTANPITDLVFQPALAMNARGDALIVWNQSGSLVASSRPAGGAWSAPETVTSVASSPGVSPQVGLDDAGNAVLVVLRWDDLTFNYRVYAFSRAAGAAAWSAPVALSPPGPSSGAADPSAGQPSLAMTGRGRAIVVWSQSIRGTPRVLGRRLARPGGPWGPVEAVSGPAREPSSPRVAMDAAGAAVAVWLERAAPRVQGGPGTMVVRTASRAAGVR